MIFSKNIPSLKLTLPTGKWMVGRLRRSLPFLGPQRLFCRCKLAVEFQGENMWKTTWDGSSFRTQGFPILNFSPASVVRCKLLICTSPRFDVDRWIDPNTIRPNTLEFCGLTNECRFFCLGGMYWKMCDGNYVSYVDLKKCLVASSIYVSIHTL